MKRAWSIHRRFVAKTNSQTRWDQVYQHLLLWTTKRAGEVTPPARTQEVSDADRLWTCQCG